MVQARFLMFQPKHSGYKVRKTKKTHYFVQLRKRLKNSVNFMILTQLRSKKILFYLEDIIYQFPGDEIRGKSKFLFPSRKEAYRKRPKVLCYRPIQVFTYPLSLVFLLSVLQVHFLILSLAGGGGVLPFNVPCSQCSPGRILFKQTFLVKSRIAKNSLAHKENSP